MDAFLELDSVDRRLLRLLQEDARATYEVLGHAVDLSAAAAFQRVRKLEQRGVIAGVHARVAPAALGRGVLAFLRAEPGAATDVARLVARWTSSDEVLECYRLSGGSFLLKLRLASLADLAAHLDAARRAGCRAQAELTLESVLERWTIPTAT